MATNKIHHHIIPESVTEQHVMIIHYQRKIGNEKGHIRMRPEDEQYIYHWLNRLVCDVANKQFINPELYKAFTKSDSDFPYGGYQNPNSIVSYAAGLCSNKYRNPSEDFTTKHLKYIEQLFVIIHNLYKNMSDADVGYDFDTGLPNDKPFEVNFSEV